MSSSTSAGDRRWSTARRGGMTVLGKVAVPKPLNLPSQRHENHGLDPNVEIVPKGTFGWGSRPSSSTSNPWGSSSLSPNADSSSNSPSRISARPSSGEAGTRPSTAGSDQVHESTPKAWNSNSRPSSASGALKSGQTSPSSLRPRSAEPRPGSSHLSRFAEPPTDISGAGTGERLVVASSKKDVFSLSTGDFPTLGSVKFSSEKNSSSQDPGLHDSDSAVGAARSNTSFTIDEKNRADDSWRRDNPHGEDGCSVGIEKWNGDDPSYQNSGILPHHFNAWRGPPVNNPHCSVWYRGPAGGRPPYGGPVPAGGFSMEPFQYYCPQIPPSALLSPQQVPPPGTGPRGPHPKSGDMYSPQIPDGYIHPGMPIRPGYYAGHVPYDGYFGPPPVGYCAPNERDIPVLGMKSGPPSIYGQFPGKNAPDSGNSPIRPLGQGPNIKQRSSDEVESSHHGDPRKPYRVLLKQHDGWNEMSEEQKHESSQKSSGPSMEKLDSSGAPSQENDWRVDHSRYGDKNLEVGAVGEGGPLNFDGKAGRSVAPSKEKSPENPKISRRDGGHARAEQKKFVTPDGPKSVTPKDSSLIQKIEGLNAKARVTDQPPDTMPIAGRDEQGNKLQVHETKLSCSTAAAETHAPQPANVQGASGLYIEEKILDGAAVGGPNTSRRYAQSGQGKFHHRGRGRFNSEESDGFRKAPAASEPLLPIPLVTSDVRRQTRISSQHTQKNEGGYVPVTSGPGDNLAEYANMKEQKLKQKQEEEEKRVREQKAKALTKLEELNRHVEAADSSKSRNGSGISTISRNLQTPSENRGISGRSSSSSCTPAISGNLIAQTADTEKNALGRSSGQLVAVSNASAGLYNQSMAKQQDNKIAADSSDVSMHSHKHHHTGYKQKQNIMPERNNTEKIASHARKTLVDGSDDNSAVANVEADSSVHQRRRNTRGHRHKPKGDESFPANPLPLAPKEVNGISSVSIEGVVLKVSESGSEGTAARTLTESNNEHGILEQLPGSAHVESQVGENIQWKSQLSLRAPINQQLNRVADRFYGSDVAVWAPVRPLNKIEVSDESSEKFSVEGQSSVRSDMPLQNSNPRSKRAEMERYVPKPVAKEMAQLGTVNHHMVPLDGRKMAEEAVQHGGSGNSSFAEKESRTADTRGHRSARAHGSWRQRGMSDSVSPQGLPVEQSQSQSAPTGEPAKRQPELHQGLKPEERSSKEQTKHHDEGLSCGGINIQTDSLDPASQVTASAVIGKRHSHLKGPRGSSLDPDQKKRYSESEKGGVASMASVGGQTNPAPEGSQMDTVAHAARESHGVVERSTLHWQPKSRPVSAQNSGSVGAEVEEILKEHDEDPVKNKMHEAGVAQGMKRERRGQWGSANEVREGGFFLGPQKSMNQNPNRWRRGDEYHGDRNSSRQQNVVGHHRDRQQRSSNYRYQPVGMYNNENKASEMEGSRDGAHYTHTGGRYKERGVQR